MRFSLSLLLLCFCSVGFCETLILTYRLDQHGEQDEYTDPIILVRENKTFVEKRESKTESDKIYDIWNETKDFIILVSEKSDSSMVSSYYIDKVKKKWVNQDFGWFSLNHDVNHCVTHGKFRVLNP